MGSDFQDRNDNSNIPTHVNSLTGGTQLITLSGGVGTATTQLCRSALIKPAAANTSPVYMTFVDASDTAADANDWPLDAVGTEVPVDNLAKLTFFSVDADAIIDILWRS